MGNQKQKWTAEEEEALLAGIAKHGCGKWKNILKDPEFASSLASRSNIDLKDKWRNLSVSNSGQGSRDKSRSQKLKVAAVAAPTSTSTAIVTCTPTPPSSNAHSSTPADANTDDLPDGKLGPRYNQMIFDALQSTQDSNGCEISFIAHFIEQRLEVPQNFRRILNSRLRRLVSQGKLEKVQNSFRICKDSGPGTKARATKPRQSQNSGETLEEASRIAAFKVAEGENKSFLAAEAVREAEKVAKMAEDTDAVLQFVTEIYEQCLQGKTVVLA